MEPRQRPKGPDQAFIDRLTKGTMVAIVALIVVLLLGLIFIFLTWLASLI